jgi:hypothetical protein
MEWMKLAVAIDDIGQASKVENLAWSEVTNDDGELVEKADTII